MNDLPEILKSNNYLIPKCIKEYSDDNIRIKSSKDGWYLYTYEKDKSKWQQQMAYNISHKEALEFFSHYDLAYGHVICAGLGFGCREQWILTKPNVTKLTVLEKNPYLIEYHKKYYDNNKIEYICCDFSEYKGTCDVLLIDTWEEYKKGFIKNSVNIFKSLENISCKSFWAWPLEYSYSYNEYKKLLNIFDNLACISEEKYNYYCSIRKFISNV
jgi:hypothetical protein